VVTGFRIRSCSNKRGRRSADRRTIRCPRHANECCHSLALRARKRASAPQTSLRSLRKQAAKPARLSALHRGSCLGDRTPPLSLGPRFLESPGANGCYPSPGQCSELLTDRSSCRPGGFPRPPGSGLRDRARAPHSLHHQDRIRTVPCDERDVWPCNSNGDYCQASVTAAVTEPVADDGNSLQVQVDRLMSAAKTGLPHPERSSNDRTCQECHGVAPSPPVDLRPALKCVQM
jgi:hypothetical protein